MFSLLESFRSAIQSVRAHGFRSFLTTLGIIIGVSSTIAVISVIQGLSYSINQQFEGFGAKSLTISSYTPLKEALKGKTAIITNNDLLLVKEKIDGIAHITPLLFAQQAIGSKVRYKGETAYPNVQGTTYSYQNVQNLNIKFGRFLSFADNKTRRKVVVIGEELRKNLNLPVDPVGEYIEVSGEWLKIVGLTEPKGSFFGFSQDDFVLVPYSTMQNIVGHLQQPDIRIQIQVKDINNIEAMTVKLKTLLRKLHKLKPDEPDDFKIQTSEQLTEGISKIIDTMTLVLGGVVSISLLVGGIGIMNIMLVSVTERTREIGICKAIGAKRHHILLQFLIEAIVLSLLGGIIGILLGYGLGVMASAMIPNFPAANIPLWAIGLAFGFSAFVGIIFGILPAAKAANLDPIDALRYE